MPARRAILRNCSKFHSCAKLFISSRGSKFVYKPFNMSETTEVKEGKAKVLTPKSVFYNPVQEFNRDLTVAVISEFVTDHYKYFSDKKANAGHVRNADAHDGSEADSACNHSNSGENSPKEMEVVSPSTNVDDMEAGTSYPNGIRILEGLAASGLRSIRFGLEIPGVKEIVANDFDRNAVSFIDQNIARNNLEGLVRSNCGDAAMFMYKNREFKDRFDVIDLDPYGSASVFLDSTVQAVRDGGLLCITCTDMAVLCGNSCETCYSKYGAVSLKAKFGHEMALRIILQSIESAANRYARYIVPLISMSADFYARVFVKVYKGQTTVKQSVTKLAYVYHCSGCGDFTLQRLASKTPTKGDNYKFTPALAPSADKACPHCGFKYHIGGPIWAEPIHDVDFIQRVLKRVSTNWEAFGTSERILGMLSVMAEELPVPLFYRVDEICNVLHCTSPSIVQFRSAILNAGYQASLSHAAKNSHKTDAPGEVIWDIMRAWVKEHPVKPSRLTEGTPAKAILDQKQKLEVSFTPHPNANPKSRQDGLVRWQMNPEPEWGPRPRAKQSGNGDTVVERREKGQAKRKEQQKNRSFLKQYPCKKFKSGDCEMGDECCYTHNQPTDSQ